MTRCSKLCDCGSDCWDIDRLDHRATCYNCGKVRPFYPRPQGQGRTPSQQKAIDRLLARIGERAHVADLVVEDLDWGACSVSVRAAYREDLSESLADYRFHVLLGRRGAIKSLTRFGLGPCETAKGRRALFLV